jgi:HEAT repeat protein
MRTVKTIFIALALAYLLNTMPTAYAQPDTPKSEIPEDIDKDVRMQIRELYSIKTVPRAEAIYALGNMGERAKAAVPYLISMLEDNVYVYSDHKTGDKGAATPAIMAVEALGKIKDQRAVEHLVLLMKGERYSDEIKKIQRYSATALIRIGGTRAAGLLLKILEDKSSESGVKGLAIQVLGKIGDKSVVDPLIEILKDETIGIRGDVAKALGEIGDPRAIRPLIFALESEDIVSIAAESLGKITGRDFGTDQKKWLEWYEKEGKAEDY